MSHSTEMNALLGSLLGEKRSHPNKLLVTHLQNVADFACRLAFYQGININDNLLTTIALTHDLGKVHPKFQKLLDGKGSGVNHAKTSAWFTYSITEDILAAEIICRHHTGLRNLEDLITDWLNDQSFKDMKNLLPDWPFKVSEKQVEKLQDTLFDLKYEINIEQWLKVRLLYSLLISADRMDAIGINCLSDKKIPPFSQPDLPTRSVRIDNWRKEIKDICLQRANEIDKPGVYTLTLPTGAGKTLTGLSIAYEWAKRFEAKSIIYALPFISIVEQTASVAKNIFDADHVQEDHSLAYGKDDDNIEYSTNSSAWNKMSTLFRYWREPVVLTTLVHLWDALFSPKANRTMNFHRLSNAIVILDEPQTISPHLWKGFGKVLSYLSQKFNTYFLLMTATQPQIASEKELAPPNTFFPFNRHKYEVLIGDNKDIKKVTISDLSGILKEKLPLYERSGLIVVNRKKTAIDAFKLLQSLDLNAPVLLLSGWVTPYRRRIILRYLKWLEKKGQRHYLAATQVIEAGVDLDFGWVFRDLGPIDSIIQVGGRCNRHCNENYEGKVLVAEVTNDRGQPTWRKIYDEIMIDKTKEVLRNNPNFKEREAATIVNEYYKKILEGLASVPIYDRLSQGQWGEYSKLIDDEESGGSYNITVFIEENSKLIPMLKKLEETDWTLEARDEQKKIIQKVMQYAIEIPKELISACRSFCAQISTYDDEPVFSPVFEGRAWLLRKEAIKKEGGLYSPLLGFMPPETKDIEETALFL